MSHLNNSIFRQFVDIQIGRLTPRAELPHSGRMNLGRRCNAGAAIRQTLLHDAMVLLILTLNSRRRCAAGAGQAIYVKRGA
jgi:hypothetical protein